MAGHLWWRCNRGGRDICDRGAPIHGDWCGAAGIFWRDATQRSAGYLAPTSTRTDDRKRRCAAASVGVRMAANDWSIALRSDDCGDGTKADRGAAAMDGERFGLSIELDGRRAAASTETDGECRAGRGWRCGDEGRIWAKLADSSICLRIGAADRVR